MGRYYMEDPKLLGMSALNSTISRCEDFIKMGMLQKKDCFGVCLLHRNP